MAFGGLSPQQMLLVWNTTQQLLQSGLLKKRSRPEQDIAGAHRVFVRNASGYTVPPFGCMQVAGTEEYSGRTVITVTRPTSLCGEYVFNSEFEIPNGEPGWAYSHGQVRMIGSAGTYESCKRFAPIVGSFEVEEGPGPFLVYGADSSYDGAVRGRIVGDHCKARWIKFEYTTGEENDIVEPTAFYDGPDPSECGDVEVEYPCGEPLCDSEVIAFYDPNTGKYQAVTTPAAMLGEPVTHSVVRSIANDDCGVEVGTTEYKMFPNSCNPSIDTSVVELGTETPVVVSISSDACGNISYAYQNIRGFICGNEVEFADFDINFDGVEFVTAAAFGPPSCSGEATYRIGLNVGLSTWQLVTPCEDGCESEPPALPDSIPTPETFETVPCSSSADRQCGLNLQMGTICADTGSGAPLPTIVHVPLPLEPVKVVTEIYDNATDAIVIEQKTIYVCNWEAYPDDEIAIGDCESGSSGA